MRALWFQLMLASKCIALYIICVGRARGRFYDAQNIWIRVSAVEYKFSSNIERFALLNSCVIAQIAKPRWASNWLSRADSQDARRENPHMMFADRLPDVLNCWCSKSLHAIITSLFLMLESLILQINKVSATLLHVVARCTFLVVLEHNLEMQWCVEAEPAVFHAAIYFFYRIHSVAFHLIEHYVRGS